jgi:hypothetical protein
LSTVYQWIRVMNRRGVLLPWQVAEMSGNGRIFWVPGSEEEVPRDEVGELGPSFSSDDMHLLARKAGGVA